MKRVFAVGGITAIMALSGASMANATPSYWECADFATPVIISGGYDPENLDIDGDGIGCEDNPGEPMAYDLYANLKGDDETPSEPSVEPTTKAPAAPTKTPELADTGFGPDEHPIRWMAVGGSLILAGGVVYVVGKRRDNS
jgi:hypothetical protein